MSRSRGPRRLRPIRAQGPRTSPGRPSPSSPRFRPSTSRSCSPSSARRRAAPPGCSCARPTRRRSPTTSSPATTRLPAIGVYDYRVTARLRTWTSGGVASVTVAGDTTAPASTIAFPSTRCTAWRAGTRVARAPCAGRRATRAGATCRRWRSAFARARATTGTAAHSPARARSGISRRDIELVYGFGASSFPADGAYTVSSRATDDALNVQSPVTTQPARWTRPRRP